VKKLYLGLYPVLILIVSCSGVPKTANSGQLAVVNEQAPTELAAAINDEQLTDMSVPSEPTAAEQIADADMSVPVSEPEEPALAETAAEEEKPQAEYTEYVENFVFEASDPADETSVIVMETLRPVNSPSLLEMLSPEDIQIPTEVSVPDEAPEIAQNPPTEAPSPKEALTPKETPAPQTAQIVPPVRESRPPAPKETPAPNERMSIPNETPEIAQQHAPPIEQPPLPDYQPQERILQPDYPITFSRVARVTVGQLVEIPFRGRDWVFLGEVGARRGIAYDSRKLDPEGESFIFRVEASGTYALKFYRQDFAHDLILNDHVQIIADGAPETTGLGWFNPATDRSRVIAGPRWPNFLEPQQRIDSRAEQQYSLAIEEPAALPPVTVQPPAVVRPPVTPPASQPSAARNQTARPQGPSGSTVAQANPAQSPSPAPSSAPSASTPNETPAPKEAPEPVSPDSLLKQAKDEFNAGRIASAITLLDQYSKSLPSGSDEAWWLYGQCFEANSPNRNMLSALEYYRRLVREYPQSSRLNDARRRISYLERYYINIQ